MSLTRLVYYSGLFSGWAAFFGWLAGEILVLRGDAARSGLFGLAIVGGLVGAAIGAGLNTASGLSNSQWHKLVARILIGLIGGGLGGLLGILAGNLAYTTIHLPRFIGFMLLGLAVGIVDGVADLSLSKIRNGVIGGLVGGLVGGLLFNPLVALLQSDSGIASRATAFVILGLCLGAFIGLTQVVLREAWLTVVDGYRPGRQLILSRPVTVLGRGDHLQLPFIGVNNSELEIEHCRIVKQNDGSYRLEDMNSKIGVAVNQQKLAASRPLADGDMIKVGKNHVRFNERRKRAGQSAGAGPTSATAGTAAVKSPAPPPPPPGRPLAPPPPRPAATTTPSPAASAPKPAVPASPAPTTPAALKPTAAPPGPLARRESTVTPPPPPKPMVPPPPPPPRKPSN